MNYWRLIGIKISFSTNIFMHWKQNNKLIMLCCNISKKIDHKVLSWLKNWNKQIETIIYCCFIKANCSISSWYLHWLIKMDDCTFHYTDECFKWDNAFLTTDHPEYTLQCSQCYISAPKWMNFKPSKFMWAYRLLALWGPNQECSSCEWNKVCIMSFP